MKCKLAILLFATTLCRGREDTTDSPGEWQHQVDVACESAEKCVGKLVKIPKNYAPLLSIEYMSFEDPGWGWTYEIDIACGPWLEYVGLLCGTSPGSIPCSTRYPAPVFECQYDGPWAFAISANNSQEHPPPLRLKGIVWGCNTPGCPAGTASLSKWKAPVISLIAIIAAVALFAVIYHRCHMAHSGGASVRASQIRDTSSLTTLWHTKRSDAVDRESFCDRHASFASSEGSLYRPQGVPQMDERSSLIAAPSQTQDALRSMRTVL